MRRTALLATVFCIGAFPLCWTEAAQAPAVVVNVRDLGAKADGKTDDRLAIQKAINQAGIAGGRVLLPPSETPYLIRGTLGIHRSNVELHGPGAVIKLADRTGNANILTIEGKPGEPIVGVTVRGLTIDANYGNQPKASGGRGRAIYVLHATKVKIDKVTIKRSYLSLTFGVGATYSEATDCLSTYWGDDGFNVTGDRFFGKHHAHHIKFVRCRAANAPSEADGGMPGRRDDAWEIEDGCHDIELIDCVAENAGGQGFGVRNHGKKRGHRPCYLQNITFTRCRATNMGHRGWWVHGGGRYDEELGMTPPAVLVKGIKLIDCQSDSVNTFCNGARDVEITGGRFTGPVLIGMGEDTDKGRKTPAQAFGLSISGAVFDVLKVNLTPGKIGNQAVLPGVADLKGVDEQPTLKMDNVRVTKMFELFGDQKHLTATDCSLPGAADEDLRCLSEKYDAPTSALVYSQLQQQAYAALDRRDKAFEKLGTAEQIRAHQTRLREFFIQQLGGFPQRTPLNAHVAGKLSGDGYRIEKVIFESQPNHHVTAVLYLPDSSAPYPGVVVASGHSRTAKAAAYNQRFGIALARSGIAALCYDPIGQGERSQILTAEGEPRFSDTTREHSLIGVGAILVGTNTARYRIWDGIRAIDYLANRADIESKRIGFTGCSGGGTLTSYVMALDDRVSCAAPACYLSTFRRLIGTIGPQDAEQNIFGQIKYGMDHPDYILMRAPRPTLISATTGDYFDIRGAWDNYRQAKRVYTRLGFSERIDLVEADGKHGVQPANLVAIVRWMRRWLLDKDDAVQLAEISVHSEDELRCTENGQVLLLQGERSVFDLNVEQEQRLAVARRDFWEKSSPNEALRAVRKTVGVRSLDEIGNLSMKKVGRVQRDRYHIDKLVLYTPTGFPIPALMFYPEKPKDDAYLYLHGEGKQADGAVGGPIEKLVSQGFVVVAVDLRGFGETATEKRDDLLGDWKTYFLAYLVGRSLVGLRTEDALACGRWVAYDETDKPRRVHLVGVGTAGVPALHAAALEPDLFATVKLRHSLTSWAKVISQPALPNVLTSTVHAALRVYDLTDLVQSFGPERVTIESGR